MMLCMTIEKQILTFLEQNPGRSSAEIRSGISEQKNIATIKRVLSKLVDRNLIITTGKGKATRYALSPYYNLLREIDLSEYYAKEIDERSIIGHFNFSLLTDVLPTAKLFTDDELAHLNVLQKHLKKHFGIERMRNKKRI